MAESFSHEILRHAPQKRRWMRNPVLPSSCVTPAGTSNELDVQNEWEETHTHRLAIAIRSPKDKCVTIVILTQVLV